MLTRKEQCALAFLCLTAQGHLVVSPQPGKAPGPGLGEPRSEEDSLGLPRCRLPQGPLVLLGLRSSQQGCAHGRWDALSKRVLSLCCARYVSPPSVLTTAPGR